MNVVVRSDLPADQLIAAVRARHPAGRSHTGDGKREDDRRHRPQRPAARASQLAGHDVLRPGGAGHGDARHLRRGVVLRPAAQRGARHAAGPRRRQPRSRGARPRRRHEALAGGHGGGIDRARRRRLAARYGTWRSANFGWLPFAGSTGVVALVSAAATAVPAWRTTLLSPMVAIREQPPSVWQWTREGMQRAVRDIRQAVGGDDSGSDISPADMLTAFVDAARGADSYTGALRRRARQRVRRTRRRIGRAARAARRLSG